jgi:hypothetical protein
MAGAHSLEGLMKWLGRPEWQDAFNELMVQHLGPPCAEANVALDKLPVLLGEHHSSVLWGCVLEDFLARNLADGRNIVDEYLKRRGWKESASTKAYITALRSSVMSLYEVSEIVREESFLARDLVRGGEPVRVSERSGTRMLKPWDRIAARIVQVGQKSQMAGGALPFDYDASEVLLKALRQSEMKASMHADKLARIVGRGDGHAQIAVALSDTELLRASAFIFTNVWLDHALRRVLHPTLPKMFNSDDEEIEFTTVSYPLKHATTADAIASALDSIPALRRADETVWNWIGVQKRAERTKAAVGQKFITTLDDGSLVLGTVALKNKMLVLEANSRQRAEGGRNLLEPVLGGLVDKPLVEARTVDQLMASPRAAQSKQLSSGLTPDEERAVVHANLDRHYMNLLDQPIPMLGNISPLEAAKTAKGQEKLVHWLKYLENGAARNKAGSPLADYDFSWMWERLGVADLRR